MAEKIIYRGLGRRKSSVARVTVNPGSGKIIINKRPAIDYLKSSLFVQDINQPLDLTDNLKSFDISVNVRGGGLAGQAGAIRLGIARALLQVDAGLRPVLKKNKMLSRDSRIKERKKPGLRKARKARQFSKR